MKIQHKSNYYSPLTFSQSNIKASDIANFAYPVDLEKDSFSNICQKEEKYQKGKAFCFGTAGFLLSYLSNNKISQTIKECDNSLKEALKDNLPNNTNKIKEFSNNLLKLKAKHLFTCLGIGSLFALIPYGLYHLVTKKDRTAQIQFITNLHADKKSL